MWIKVTFLLLGVAISLGLFDVIDGNQSSNNQSLTKDVSSLEIETICNSKKPKRCKVLIESIYPTKKSNLNLNRWQIKNKKNKKNLNIKKLRRRCRRLSGNKRRRCVRRLRRLVHKNQHYNHSNVKVHQRRHHHSLRCNQCRPGHFVSNVCNGTHNTICSPCPNDTFQPHNSIQDRCTPCSRCGETLYVIHQCTPSSDTVCDSCLNRNVYLNETLPPDYRIKCQLSNGSGLR